jgi:hypothetical protein
VTTSLEWLRPRPPAVPDGVRVDDVGPVGWQVLVRDGALRPVWGDLAAPVGRPAGPELRAGAVRALVPPRAVLGREGAVWVHTGGPVPPRFDVLVQPRVRRPAPHPQRVPHECPLPASDIVRIGPLRVTTVDRTALDVARWLPPARAEPLLRRLVQHAGLEAAALLPTAEALPPRDRGRARAALEAVAGRASVARRASGADEGG